jgi:hypothetical protein
VLHLTTISHPFLPSLLVSQALHLQKRGVDNIELEYKAFHNELERCKSCWKEGSKELSRESHDELVQEIDMRKEMSRQKVREIIRTFFSTESNETFGEVRMPFFLVSWLFRN